jgi:hypothetical protein
LNNDAARVAPAPLLEMEVAGKAIPAQQWKLDSIKDLPLGFEVSYRSTDASLPLRCTVTAQTDDSPEARFSLSGGNKGVRNRMRRFLGNGSLHEWHPMCPRFAD